MTPTRFTALYVPGDRPDRFDKAVASGAQAVILDLEDAVAGERKRFARESVVEWIGGRAGVSGGPAIQVRVNRDTGEDLAALAAVLAGIELRVPKVETAGDLDGFDDGGRVTALIETAAGVENASSIARHPAVGALALGDADLASDLGTASEVALDHARLRLLYAARAAGLLAPMMSAYASIDDLDGLRRDTERGRELGLVGRTAIHPKQLAVIADVFRPSDDEVAWARAVLDATARGGVATLPSGEMVDAAMTGRARRILADYRAFSSTATRSH